jgi:hypothetical protein
MLYVGWWLLHGTNVGAHLQGHGDARMYIRLDALHGWETVAHGCFASKVMRMA